MATSCMLQYVQIEIIHNPVIQFLGLSKETNVIERDALLNGQ